MCRKYRLLAVISSLSGGGAERQMAILCKYLDRSKFFITLCLFNRCGHFLDELPPDIQIVDLAKRSKWDGPALVRKLADIIRATEPHIILSKLQYPNTITAAAHLLARRKVRMVLCEEINLQQALPRSTHRYTRTTLLKWAYRRADAVVAPSFGAASVLKSDFKVEDQRLNIIPNAIEFQRIQRAAREAVTHAFFESTEPTIISVGRLTEQKGYPYLLRAIAHVNSEVRCNLIVLGEGEQREMLQKMASELTIGHRVSFLGLHQNPFKFMARARVFVLSSLWESFGNVLIEAMALGIPVVSTRAPFGPEEIIEDGRTGLLVRPGDPHALARAIVRILTDDSLRVTIAQEGYKAAEKYDITAIVGSYERLLLGLSDHCDSDLTVIPSSDECL